MPDALPAATILISRLADQLTICWLSYPEARLIYPEARLYAIYIYIPVYI